MADGVELVVDARAALGEGPSWDARRGRLLWVDILGWTLHLLDPASGRDEAVDRPRMISAAIPAEDGRILVCEQGLISLLDLDTNAAEPVAPIESEVAGNRTNDAKCDPAGRLWVGTMDVDVASACGALYTLDPDGLRRVLPGRTCSNGIAWSPDGSIMYYIDSMTGGVDAYRYEAATGAIADRRRLIELPEREGIPDGMCVDADGCLWFAVWGHGSVRRHGPDGREDRRVPLPTPNVTSCCFGDPDLGGLYITTARCDPADAAGGGLFRLDPGVAGLPTNVFRRPRAS